MDPVLADEVWESHSTWNATVVTSQVMSILEGVLPALSSKAAAPHDSF